jgi:hypothetical protein
VTAGEPNASANPATCETLGPQSGHQLAGARQIRYVIDTLSCVHRELRDYSFKITARGGRVVTQHLRSIRASGENIAFARSFANGGIASCFPTHECGGSRFRCSYERSAVR